VAAAAVAAPAAAAANELAAGSGDVGGDLEEAHWGRARGEGSAAASEDGGDEADGGGEADGGPGSDGAEGGSGEDGDEDEPEWRMPSRFVPLPPGFQRPAAAPLDLRRASHADLLAAAARHNRRHLPPGREDPTAATYAGVLERVALRPGAAPAVALTMGGVPRGTEVSKAWASIGRGMRAPLRVSRGACSAGADARGRGRGALGQAGGVVLARSGAASGGPAQRATRWLTAARSPLVSPPSPPPPQAAAKAPAARPSSSGGGPAEPPAAGPAAGGGGGAAGAQQPPPVCAEEAHWRARLGAFLGYRPHVPRLARNAPALELRLLWHEARRRPGRGCRRRLRRRGPALARGRSPWSAALVAAHSGGRAAAGRASEPRCRPRPPRPFPPSTHAPRPPPARPPARRR
jgi:hypothetical protein